MYRFIESICVRNGEIERSEYHLQRIERTLKAHGGTGRLDMFRPWFQQVQFPQSGIFKWRFEYTINGIYESQMIPYKRLPIRSLKLMSADALEYDFKSVDRSGIELLFKRRGEADDILIVKNGYLTDASYANVVLWNGSDWHTPLHPLLKGTRRAALLDSGDITEASIKVDQIWKYKRLRLINAMRPFSENDDITITKDTII